MIYVDSQRQLKPRQQYSHMISDVSLNELHTFAASCGIPRHWFQYSNSGIPHYDLNPTNYSKAIQGGATLISSKRMMEITNESKHRLEHKNSQRRVVGVIFR